MIGFKNEGTFEKTKKFLNVTKDASKSINRMRIMAIAQEGVSALEAATPVDTGKTASSWGYELEEENGKLIINWTNSNVQNHINIAIILQYGHYTRTGGYVQGRDYINPALRPIFDKMTDDMWKAVVSL